MRMSAISSPMLSKAFFMTSSSRGSMSFLMARTPSAGTVEIDDDIAVLVERCSGSWWHYERSILFVEYHRAAPRPGKQRGARENRRLVRARVTAEVCEPLSGVAVLLGNKLAHIELRVAPGPDRAGDAQGHNLLDALARETMTIGSLVILLEGLDCRCDLLRHQWTCRQINSQLEGLPGIAQIHSTA